jgi:hypothetical protein
MSSFEEFRPKFYMDCHFILTRVMRVLSTTQLEKEINEGNTIDGL